MSPQGELNAELRHLAGTIGLRGGRPVPLSFGSAAGELAVCLRAVGLVCREDLRVTELRGDPLALDLLTCDSLARELPPGEAAGLGSALWGRPAPEAVLVVGPPGTPLSPFPDGSGRSPATAALAIAEDSLTAIGVVGPATPALLTELGATAALPLDSDWREAGICPLEIAGGPAACLATDDARALLLVARTRAVAAWRAAGAAGRPLGLGYVGAEAAERFEVARSRPPHRDTVPL